MFELIPDHLRLYVVLGGLLLIFLLVGSLAQKYEQYLAAKRMAVRRILSVTGEIERALQQTQDGGLPDGIGRLLRNELLARYITVRQVYPRYPRINQWVAQAEERARMESNGSAAAKVTAITSTEALNQYINGVSTIIGLLNSRALGRGLSAADRSAQQLKLLDFQLSVASHYYTRIGLEFARQGAWYKALRSIRTLDSFLYGRPNATALARDLRREARTLLEAFNQQRLPGEPPQLALQQESG